MGQTKKQKTVAEKVAAESPYQRAAALWVARKLGLNPDKVFEVNFGFEGDYQISEYTWQSGDGALLEFKYAGHRKRLAFDEVTPGQFIEECVALLAEVQTV